MEQMPNEKKLPGELSVEECVMVLINMRERTKRYGDMFPLYPADYVQKLSEYESEVIDKVISILINREK